MTLFTNKPMRTFTFVSIGLLARILVTSNFKESLRQRVEITTSISDWKRAHEAIYLWNSGLDPYAGNVFHEYPISLQVYKIISNYFNVDLAFAVIDTITALLLHKSVFNQLVLSDQTEIVANSQSAMVLLMYLFSPINIISCAGQSTSIFTNFLVAVICFILPMKPFRVLTCVLCAFLACNNIHYSTLILPIFLCMEFCSSRRQRQGKNTTNSTEPYYSHQNFFPSLLTSICICLASIITLLLTSYFLMGNSWSFLQSTYLFVLCIQDLTPNIGMFWYFFTEMFEHFLDFFTWIVQINAFIHVVPLSIYLRDKPFFAFYMTILTSTMFQPYPNMSNIGLITSLLPQFMELFPHMKHGLKVICSCITCISLGPIFWHLWIMMGTANSNFYFGVTLAFMSSLILFMVDLLNAHGYLSAKEEFDQYQKERKSKTNSLSK